MQGLFTHNLFKTKSQDFFKEKSRIFENKVLEKVFPDNYPLVLNDACCEEIEDDNCCVPD